MFRASSTRRARLLGVLIALALGGGVVTTSAAPVSAQGQASISIQPVTEGSGTRRAAFVFTMAAGTVQTDSVVVANGGNETANVRVYVANAGSGAGPGDSLMTPVYFLFTNGFNYFKMGYASALAWTIFGIILILTLGQFRLAKGWVHYEAEE